MSDPTGGKMKKYLGLLIILAIVAGCSLSELGMPTWTTILKLNIINDTYSAEDLADQDSSLVTQGGVVTLYETMNEAEELDFTTDPVNDEKYMEIGELEINDPEPTGTSVSLSEIDPTLSNGFVPAPGIPAFTLPVLLKDDIQPFDQFQQITIISGMANLTILNNTALWMGNVNAGEPLVLRLLDGNHNELIRHTFSEDVPPEAAYSVMESVDLAGENLVNEIQIELSGGSRGSDGQAANIIVENTVDVTIEVTDIVADDALALIPPQTFQDTVDISLDEDVVIYNAEIDEGDYAVDINFENSIDVGVCVLLHIDKLKLAGEDEYFTREIIIPRSGGNGQTSYHTETIEIGGASLGDGTPLDVLAVEVDAVSIDSGDEYRQISSGDGFNVDAHVSALNFEHISGVLKPREQDPIEGDTTLDIDYPQIIGDFSITGLSDIALTLNTPVPASMDVNITAYADDGESVSMVDMVSGELPHVIINQGQSEVLFTSDQYNINEMISILPDSISYTIYPIVGDSTQIFVYTKGDSIRADIEITAQLDINADCVVIPKNDAGDPDIQVIDTKDIEQKHIDAFQQATLVLHFRNTLGVTAGTDIVLSDRRATGFNEIMEPDTTEFTIISVPDIVQTTGSAEEQIEVSVSQQDIQYFASDSVFVIPRIHLLSEEGTPISGMIELRGSVEIEVEVSNNLSD